MPRLAHLGVDAKTLQALESVQVPVLTVESFLSRDEDQIKRETGMPFQVSEVKDHEGVLLVLLLVGDGSSDRRPLPASPPPYPSSGLRHGRL